MGISKKTLLIVASILGAIIISLFFYLQFYVLEQYIELEKIDLTNKIIQSVKILNSNIGSLEKVTATIAASGETYSFLKQEEPENDRSDIFDESYILDKFLKELEA